MQWCQCTLEGLGCSEFLQNLTIEMFKVNNGLTVQVEIFLFIFLTSTENKFKIYLSYFGPKLSSFKTEIKCSKSTCSSRICKEIEIDMLFPTEWFLEVAIESWPEWYLNPRPLNSIQTLYPTTHTCMHAYIHTYIDCIQLKTK